MNIIQRGVKDKKIKQMKIPGMKKYNKQVGWGKQIRHYEKKNWRT